MPRDFVPCVYTEQLFDDGATTRCQVIECFTGVHIATHGLLFHMTLDSHASHRDTDGDVEHARAHLFDTFYAAMADLE